MRVCQQRHPVVFARRVRSKASRLSDPPPSFVLASRLVYIKPSLEFRHRCMVILFPTDDNHLICHFEEEYTKKKREKRCSSGIFTKWDKRIGSHKHYGWKCFFVYILWSVKTRLVLVNNKWNNIDAKEYHKWPICCGRDFLERRQTAISTYYHITPVDEFEGN